MKNSKLYDMKHFLYNAFQFDQTVLNLGLATLL